MDYPDEARLHQVRYAVRPPASGLRLSHPPVGSLPEAPLEGLPLLKLMQVLIAPSAPLARVGKEVAEEEGLRTTHLGTR